MCDKNCSTTSCPFAYTEESEQAQNYGCLPTPFQIMAMRIVHGKTWACHSDNSKPCIGGLKNVRNHGFDNSVIDQILITEETVTSELISYTDEQANQITQKHADLLRVKFEKIENKR
jgi:hypothetical protein